MLFRSSRILTLSEALLEESPAAVPEFIKGCAQIMDRLSLAQVERWYEEGVNLLRQNPDGGLAFFKIESAHSESVLEALSSGVEFDRIKPVMEMYCRGLAGAEIKLAASEDLVSKGIGWVSSESPSTEGSTVFVPTLVDRYPSKDENFGWFKVVSTHQVAHLEFGSFYFEFDEPSTIFQDRRADLEKNKVEKERPEGEEQVEGEGLERAWITDMQRFFNLFEDRKLSLDIFTVVEDGRLDFRVKHEYPGIRAAYSVVQADSHKGRPEIESLPVREALVEFLVRLSLQQYDSIPAPLEYVEQAKQITDIARRVLDATSTVQDAAEATLRIYAIIAAIPNEEVPPEDWEDVDTGEEQQEEYTDPDEMEQLLQQLAEGMEMELRPDGESDYE